MYARHITPKLRAALADTPVVLIHGARQSGKTTLARDVATGASERRFLTLDDLTVLSAAGADPQAFIRGLEGPVTLDEVQRLPALFRVIKAEVDRRRTAGRFLLTGSANVLALPELSEALAGRVEIITLWPLSQGEIDGRIEGFIDAAFSAKFPESPRGPVRGAPFIERLYRGGYPEPLGRADPERRNAWYASYVASTLQRDVRDLSNIEGLLELPRLLALVASRAAGLLNHSDLARGMAIPLTTLKRYFALLQATFLIVLVPAWSANRGLRLTKAPKAMVADTGLACHLLGVERSRLQTDGAVRGALLENFVAMELIKQAGWSRTKPSLHHFRTVAGREVDLVLEDRAGRVVGVEVRSGTTVNSSDFAGLRTLAEAAGKQFVRGILLHDGSETIAFGKDLWAAPISALWTL